MFFVVFFFFYYFQKKMCFTEKNEVEKEDGKEGPNCKDITST